MFAFSGIVDLPPGEKGNPAFLNYAVSLAPGDGKKRVCFIPTATGDSPFVIDVVSEVFASREDVNFSVLTLFTQPSVPDVRAHLLAQDVLLVAGGWSRASAAATTTRRSGHAGSDGPVSSSG